MFNQTRVNVKVLQGESRLAYNNLLLGEVSVPVPAGPRGKEAVDITYTYDINSLLEVEIHDHSTGVRRKIIIQNEQNRISEAEAAARFETLQYLKQNPREEEANRLQLLRGERLYEETSGLERSTIDRAIMEFERVLSGQDRTDIEKTRKRLTKLLDEIEFKTTRQPAEQPAHRCERHIAFGDFFVKVISRSGMFPVSPWTNYQKSLFTFPRK